MYMRSMMSSLLAFMAGACLAYLSVHLGDGSAGLVPEYKPQCECDEQPNTILASVPESTVPEPQEDTDEQANPFLEWALKHKHGPIMWKWNAYLGQYWKMFKPFQNKPITFLLIGVNTGGDLFMWSSFFGPNAKIYGIDINPECAVFTGAEKNIIKVFTGSQADQRFLEDVMAEIGTDVDIVLDDASHHPGLTIKTILYLWKYVKPWTGMYVIEDTHKQMEVVMSILRVVQAMSGFKKETMQVMADPFFHEFRKSPGVSASLYFAQVALYKDGPPNRNQTQFGDERLTYALGSYQNAGQEEFSAQYPKIYPPALANAWKEFDAGNPVNISKLPPR